MNEERNGDIEDGGEVDLLCQPLTDGRDNWAEFLLALEILRSARRPGTGKLSLRAAIGALREQDMGFRRWANSGDQISRVEAWVEGNCVMRRVMHMEVDSAQKVDLQGFRFSVTSPDDAVMQLLGVDLSDERVALLTLRLKAVPRDGLLEARRLPNGQTLRLAISQSCNTRFNVRVNFDSRDTTREEPAQADKTSPPFGDSRTAGTNFRMGASGGSCIRSAIAAAVLLILVPVATAYLLKQSSKPSAPSQSVVPNRRPDNRAALGGSNGESQAENSNKPSGRDPKLKGPKPRAQTMLQRETSQNDVVASCLSRQPEKQVAKSSRNTPLAPSKLAIQNKDIITRNQETATQENEGMRLNKSSTNQDLVGHLTAEASDEILADATEARDKLRGMHYGPIDVEDKKNTHVAQLEALRGALWVAPQSARAEELHSTEGNSRSMRSERLEHRPDSQ